MIKKLVLLLMVLVLLLSACSQPQIDKPSETTTTDEPAGTTIIETAPVLIIVPRSGKVSRSWTGNYSIEMVNGAVIATGEDGLKMIFNGDVVIQEMVVEEPVSSFEATPVEITLITDDTTKVWTGNYSIEIVNRAVIATKDDGLRTILQGTVMIQER